MTAGVRSFAPGDRVAGYAVVGVIGRGGQSTVYRVERGARAFAMKVPLPREGHLPGDDVLRREAALLTCVGHRGAPRVHDVGTTGGCPYLVMELVAGAPLTDVLAAGPLGIERVAATAADVAALLAATHRAGVVHRDIKPGNILVHEGGPARVVDFSLAARSGGRDTGVVAGTMLYCAPEQSGTLARPVDGRADLYALGAVLYECATGEPPFTAASMGELLRQHASAPVPDPRVARPDLPAGLAQIIRRLLAKDPDDRYPGCHELLTELGRLTGPGPRGDAPRPDPPAPPDPAGTAPAAPARRLVGRSRELGALAARWARARRGQGGAALIQGAAGVGKSRLAAELVASAAAGGAVTLVGACNAGGSMPLAALRRALDAHVRGIEARPPEARARAVEQARAAAGSAAALLGGLSPSLGALVGAPGPPADDGQLVGAAATGFLVALARAGGGLLLCLDDVQWLDDGTLSVLRRLGPELADVPLLVLATARDDRGGRAASEVLRAALGEALDLRLPLAPLDEEAVAALVADAAGGMRLDPPSTAALAAHSDGNPFVVLECLPAIVDAGLLAPRAGTWSVDAEGLRGLDLTTRADSLVLARLDGLDGPGRDLLAVAAVVGPRFTAELVAEVSGADHRTVRDVVAAATWRRLIAAGEDGDHAFVHDRIRDAVLGRLDHGRRQQVHARLAEVLDHHPSPTDTDTVYALAHHCRHAGSRGDPARTLRACTAAGHRALADHAPETALAFLDGAVEAAALTGVEPAFLHEGRGAALHRVGRCAEAVESLERAHELAEDPLERARILLGVARVHDTTWRTAEQLATVERALAEMGRPLPRGRLRRLLSALALTAAGGAVRTTRIGHGGARGDTRRRYELLVSLHDTAVLAHARQLSPGAAVELTLRQLWWVGRLGRGPESARTDIALAHLALAGGLAPLARRATRRALATTEKLGDQRLRAYVEWLWSIDRLFFGVDQGESARQVLTEQGRWLDLGLTNDLLLVLITNAFMRGDLADAERLAARRGTLLSVDGHHGHLTRHTSDAGVLALQGEARAAAAHLEDMRLPHPLRWQRVDILVAALMVAVEQHDLDGAFDGAAAEFEALDVRLLELMPSARFVYVFLALGRLEQCRAATGSRRPERLAQARAAVRQLRRAANTPLLRAYHRLARAALHQVSGRPAAALASLARAEPHLHRADAPLVTFEAARLRAHALRAQGVEGEARRHAGAALSLAEEQRWPHRARRVEAEFDLDRRPPRISSGHASSDTVALGRYRQRLDAVQQVGMAAARVLDPARLAAIALDETIRILGADRAYLFLVGDDGELNPAGGRDAEGHDLGEPTGHSATLVERVRREGRPLVLTGPEEGEVLGADSVVLHGLRSALVAPLTRDGRLAAVVYLDSRVAKGIFTNDDVGVLVALANHIVAAMETAKAARLEAAVDRANHRRDLAERVRDALADISGSLEPDGVLGTVLSTVVGLTGADRGWLVLTDEHGAPTRSVSRCAARPASPATRGGDGAPGAAADQDHGRGEGGGETWRSVDPCDPTAPAELLERVLSITEPVFGRTERDRPLRWGDCTAGAWMAIPLRARDQRVGVIVVVSERHDAFGSGEPDMAMALTGQGMVAYENARLFARVQTLATTDGLTGVATRRHLSDLAAGAFDRARAGGHPLAAMMIDVDHFKTVNDRHGHGVGDAVLQAVAARLGHILGERDLLGRYGGEEFAAVIEADAVTALAVAERLRRAVADSPAPSGAGPIAVTVSIGVAADDGDGPVATVDELFDRADRALYRAKRAGRDRVVAQLPDAPAIR